MVKAIFLDIDGTLVSFQTHGIPDSARRALNELHSRGVKIFIATGRPPLMIDNLEGLSIDGYVTMNGCCCFTPEGENIYSSTIRREDLLRLADYAKHNKIPFACVKKNEWFINFINRDVEDLMRLIGSGLPPVAPFDLTGDEAVYQIIGFFPQAKDGEIFGDVLLGCEPMRWHPTFADIVAKGNSKSRGIDKVIEYFRLDLQETMAFGDGHNDIPMLKHCALGVAMGNSNDEVKRAADYVTTSVDEDGILNALRHYGMID